MLNALDRDRQSYRIELCRHLSSTFEYQTNYGTPWSVSVARRALNEPQAGWSAKPSSNTSSVTVPPNVRRRQRQRRRSLPRTQTRRNDSNPFAAFSLTTYATKNLKQTEQSGQRRNGNKF